VSVKVVRIKVASHLAALNQPAISLEILKRQHALRPVDIHLEAMMVATRYQLAA
jgi:hypothetical protein